MKGLDSVGTVHFFHFVPLENNHLGFFTVYDGDLEKYAQDFADESTVRFRYAPSTCHWRAANASSKERRGVLSVGIGKQLSADRILQRLSRPLGSRHSSTAGRSQVAIGHRSIAVESRDHEPSLVRRDALAKEIKAPPAPAREDPGLLRRMLRRRRRENAQTEGDSGTMDRSALDLADIQGFILRGYRMPMVRHFLLTVGTPAQARRQLGRLVSGDESDAPQITTAEDWHVGFAPGPRRQSRGCPASQARLLPQHRHHVARTGGARDKRTRPKPIVQVIWRVHRRSRATSGVGRRCRSKCAAELEWRFWRRPRSRPGDAARDQPGRDEELQRQVVCLVC